MQAITISQIIPTRSLNTKKHLTSKVKCFFASQTNIILHSEHQYFLQKYISQTTDNYAKKQLNVPLAW